MYSKILIRYGELVLKKNNRQFFINALKQDIQNKLKTKVDGSYDRMFIPYEERFLDELQFVFGISSYSPVIVSELDLEKLKQIILSFVISKKGVKTFKISARRNNKNFALNSNELNNLFGGLVLENTDWKVDVKEPDLNINIEVRQKNIYVFFDQIKGLGGLPCGTSGKVLHLLSGGIDSPVAAFNLIKRGLKVDFISFVTPPQTDEKTISKMKRIIQILNKYQNTSIYYLVNYTRLMNYISLVSRQEYKINLMRRSFYRIADQVAKKYGYQALANGENIGQVASQTLESINVISSVTNLPIFRPVLTNDKVETINIATKIGTYDISIEKANETCELFAPKNPVIKPNVNEALKLEAELIELTNFEQEILHEKIEVFK
ncbi:thiamine biosynthesis ATP pyrophosphatase [Mycoplasmopsis californica]|uniref:Probable tRNA sulfurtransferase n=1 Tax=Mycoplasmopsis equigenitalium TaxID=114883 RepID=A0ABY5J1L6_9BACT|nr:tRNA uracil 4-sulfurtransferase ThiI [Mycoplasmopsis equigenitalium]UUD37157.1 tRNA 4-thiouridine(8) synthase ThiI [Mycoplasmopsis equigenitalium]VEU69537.1 thiamine biosynthesis ATP pyrophosphatase [Mycoplasmopsis californica]